MEAFSLKPPLSNAGMPHAYSTESSARWISPPASDTTLPCSELTIVASSPLRAFSSSRNLNITVERWAKEALRHCANAFAAASTAASTSDTDAWAT